MIFSFNALFDMWFPSIIKVFIEKLPVEMDLNLVLTNSSFGAGHTLFAWHTQ